MSTRNYRSVLLFYLPLAVSWMTIVLEVSLVNAFLARGPEPELSLAAYGVAFSIIMVLHSPVIMLLDVSVALSKNLPAFRSIRRFCLLVGIVVTALSLVLTFTPLCGFVLRRLMNIPPAIADATVPILRILNLVALPIAWRRVYQGVLIRYGRTNMVGVATGVRLVVLSTIMVIGQRLHLLPGGALGALAMLVGVIVEAALNQWAAQSTIEQRLVDEDTPSGVPTFGYLTAFYFPLAITMVIRHVLQPVINAGIGAAPMSELSLAAWPVALALIYTLTAPTMGLQQLTIALTEDKSSWRTVSRFVLIAGMCVSVCVVVVAFTPLLGVVLSQLFGLGEHVAALAAPAVRIMAVLPLTFALQGLFTGLLIKQADVASVSTAKTLNLVTAVLTLALVLRSTTVAGSVVAAVAMTSGALVETLWLYRRSRAATATLAGSKEEILALEQTRLH